MGKALSIPIIVIQLYNVNGYAVDINQVEQEEIKAMLPDYLKHLSSYLKKRTKPLLSPAEIREINEQIFSRSLLMDATTTFELAVQALDLNSMLFGNQDWEDTDKEDDDKTQLHFLNRIKTEIYEKYGIETETGFSRQFINVEDPEMEDFELAGNLCKFIWMKGHAGKFKQDVLAMGEKAMEKTQPGTTEYQNLSPESKIVLGEFLWGATQISYATTQYEKVYEFATRAVEVGTEGYNSRTDESPGSAVHREKMAKKLELNCRVWVAQKIRESKSETEAIEYTEKLLQDTRTADYKWAEAMTLNNLGVLYITLAKEIKKDTDKVQQYEKYLEDGLKAHKEAMEIRQQIGDSIGISSSEGNFAKYFGVKGDNDKSLEWYGKSVAYREESEDEWGAAGSRFAMSFIFINKAKEANKQEEGSGDKFNKQAVTLLGEALEGFIQVSDELGKAEISEMTTVLLANTGQNDKAEKCAGINLYFRQTQVESRTVQDLNDILMKWEWITNDDVQKMKEIKKPSGQLSKEIEKRKQELESKDGELQKISAEIAKLDGKQDPLSDLSRTSLIKRQEELNKLTADSIQAMEHQKAEIKAIEQKILAKVTLPTSEEEAREQLKEILAELVESFN